MRLAEVIIAHATRDFDGLYSYHVPDELASGLEEGALVEIPFGRSDSKRLAYVAALRDEPDEQVEPGIPLKDILRVVSPAILRQDQFELAREMRRRYFCSTAQALSLMAPPALMRMGGKKERCCRLRDEETVIEALENSGFRSLGHVRVLEFLLDAEEASLSEIMAACEVSRSVLSTLAKNGWIEFFTRESSREVEELPYLPEERVLKLNDGQQKVLDELLEPQVLKSGSGLSEYLLFGVTGSGKTEVYLRAAEKVLNEGRDVLILVPEIALTPLICSRLAQRFGEAAAVLHSRLSAGERYEQWRRIRSGEKHLVAGARSAIFAPLKNIGLIVIDEEQESSYKSERSPRYDAREIARIRAIQHHAKLLLCSATPSVVAFRRALQGRSKLLELNSRAGGAKLPDVSLIDQRLEMAAGNHGILSRELQKELEICFQRGEQAMIFLNRRGLAAFTLCRNCGQILRCENCDVSLSQHRNSRSPHGDSLLVCHYCGKMEEAPERCPSCGSPEIGPFGVGTQQVEALLKELFPDQRFLRMDRDSTLGRHGHERLIEAFARHEADCLIGTQMIAKGHDFPEVTLMGILSADQILGLPDYRAAERAFQLICQASGRAGRKNLPGKVLIQTFDPRNPVLMAAARQDYRGFYALEIEKRRLLGYPPFLDLGCLTFSGYSDTLTGRAANEVWGRIRQLLKKEGQEKTVQLYQPSHAPIERLRRKWRWRILLKSSSRAVLTYLLTSFCSYKLPEGVALQLDINPENMS